MFKNQSGQYVLIYAWDSANSIPKVGDAANITAYLSKNVGVAAATDDVNPTELDATNMKGYYYFNMLQAESNADLLALSPVSSTADIQIEPVTIYTVSPMVGTDGANTIAPDPAGSAATLASLINALENVSLAQIQTTPMAEDYADQGDEMSMAQSFSMIWSRLKSMIDTNTTSPKSLGLDDNTEVMEFLTNDATSPTEIKRV